MIFHFAMHVVVFATLSLELLPCWPPKSQIYMIALHMMVQSSLLMSGPVCPVNRFSDTSFIGSKINRMWKSKMRISYSYHIMVHPKSHGLGSGEVPVNSHLTAFHGFVDFIQFDLWIKELFLGLCSAITSYDRYLFTLLNSTDQMSLPYAAYSVSLWINTAGPQRVVHEVSGTVISSFQAYHICTLVTWSSFVFFTRMSSDVRQDITREYHITKLNNKLMIINE